MAPSFISQLRGLKGYCQKAAFLSFLLSSQSSPQAFNSSSLRCATKSPSFCHVYHKSRSGTGCVPLWFIATRPTGIEEALVHFRAPPSGLKKKNEKKVRKSFHNELVKLLACLKKKELSSPVYGPADFQEKIEERRQLFFSESRNQVSQWLRAMLSTQTRIQLGN